MNTSKLIGQVLLTFFSGTIIFVGYLYYLGATIPVEPIEEVLVDGQWVRYRDDAKTGYPGEIHLGDTYQFTDGPYINPLYLTGQAQSAWFFKGTADAELLTPDGSLLWEGYVQADERYIYDLVVPFSAEIDIGDYTGEATLVIYQTDGDIAVTETGVQYPHSYSASIVIADGNAVEEIEEDVEIGD